MDAFKTGLVIGFLFAELVAGPCVGSAQTFRSLRDRIPKPDPKKYHSLQDATDWENPYLIVRSDGIEIRGITPVGQAVNVASVAGVLEQLPNSAWPFGLVVAVQDIGLLSGDEDIPRIAANRRKLMALLKKLGVLVDPWP
jgi:hypothetical protein